MCDDLTTGNDRPTNAPKVERALAERGISQPYGLGLVGGDGEEGERGESSAKLNEMKEEMDVSINPDVA